MNDTVLKLLSEKMQELGISYAFLQWNGEPVYPYFVGEYTEEPEADESGEMRIDFILSGFTRSSWLSLEEAKARIAEGLRDYVAIRDGYAIAIYYSNSYPIPQETDELKRMEIHLDIRVWRNR